MNGNTPPPQHHNHHHPSSFPSHSMPTANHPPSSSSQSTTTFDNRNDWMGAPAIPTFHPGNQKPGALLGGSSGDHPHNPHHHHHHHPYLQYSPAQKPHNPMESVLNKFSSWTNKAETTATNIYHNLKTGSSVSETAWGKVSLTAKAITGGGLEPLYKQSFATFPGEKLNKSFACYLSTSTGPVSGTLYLSNLHIAFCSDTPLSFTAPTTAQQHTWSYYKVMVPLGRIGSINPVVMRDNSSERYIQIGTIDGHDFWFMGFVNYEKASRHLTNSICSFPATGIPLPSMHA